MAIDRYDERYKTYLEWVERFHAAIMLEHNVVLAVAAIQKCLQGFTIGEERLLSCSRRLEGLRLELEGLGLLLTALDVERSVTPQWECSLTTAQATSYQRVVEARIANLRKVLHD